jgi:peptide/nickel transport system substrate-binding protein
VDSSSKYQLDKYSAKAMTALADFFAFVKRLFRVDQSKSSRKLLSEVDKKLVLSLSKSRIPSISQLRYIKRYLTKKELRIIYFCFTLIIISSLYGGTRFYFEHLKVVPASGGEYSEGVVGNPKYINPLYSNISDIDSDLVSLVYSAIFKYDSAGKLVNDLAQDYEISADGKIYTIKIKKNVLWHNGSSLTADDIVFTFKAMRDKQYKSTWRNTFEGVNIEKVDEMTVQFILNEPYAAFLELLTFGILPRELWQEVQPSSAGLAELNLKPIGSGPYKFKSLTKDKTGIVKSYSLSANNKFYSAVPNISQINFKFFIDINEAINALSQGSINGVSYLPKQNSAEVLAKSSFYFYELATPQITAIFLNQKTAEILTEKSVRQALALALNKPKIASDFYENKISIIDGPILPESFAYDQNIKKYEFNLSSAADLLDQAGWKEVEIKSEDLARAEQEENSNDEKIKKQAAIKLALGEGKWRAKDGVFIYFRLSAVDTEEYGRLAAIIAAEWRELGIKVQIELIPPEEAQAIIIKDRNFDALIYSEILGADPDPYAFWHSSQIQQPGLNIIGYNNKKTDQLLEDARLAIDQNVRGEKYREFQQIISEEEPAIFLFRPAYTYVMAKEIKGFSVGCIYLPHDRFNNIADWYIKTSKKIIY